ncbi:nipped-B-like protein isoform X4 [Achlya hypogyna]|uniref:Sister chromatid cohesion protein n=1 Tax=Achlya hypogyna TaxID=1202772 RepID=A0A1V9ZIJ0_ACHHY|nr:nipped-B-like protein isoform X4 [Achlya hypogyna]
MSRSFPLPMRTTSTPAWRMRTRSMVSIDPAAVDMAALRTLVGAVPHALLPAERSTPPSSMDTKEPSMSPLLHAVVTGDVLALTTRETKKRKTVMDDGRKGKRPPRKNSDPSMLVTQEEKLASSIAKHSEALGEWIQDLTNHRNVHRGTKKIRQMLHVMHKSSKLVIARLPVELVQSLMALLDVQITEARSVDLFVQDRGAEEMHLLETVITALDAATCMLFVMTAPDVDRRLLSEEHIEHCALLVKHVLQRLLYPALDAVTYTVVAGEKEKASKAEKDKAHGALKKKMEKVGLVDVVHAFLDSLQELIGCLKLQDSWILQLSSVLMSAFAMDNQQASISTVQLGALRMLRAIFVHYPAHRTLLLEEVFLILVKLSTSKRNLRTYKVDEDYVQVIVVLLATLVQSCIVLSLDQVQETARAVVQLLLLKCLKKDDEVDARLHFEHFVEDVLVLLTSPDWPVAEVLTEALIAGLTGLLVGQRAKPETQATVLALHLLGKIATTLKTITVTAQASETQLLHALEDNHATTASELLIMYAHQKSAHISEDAQAFHLSRIDEGNCTATSHEMNRDDARSVMGYFLSKRTLCGLFDGIFVHILGFLSRGQSTLRTRVLRSIVGVIDADPSLMTSDALHKAITSCLLDESNAVRQAAVDLVGNYVDDQPSLFPQYSEMLIDRIRDKGISVRKCVLKIFRHYIAHAFDVTNATVSACLRTLIERLADPSEDEQIKDAIVETLQEVWFDDDLTALQARDSHGEIIPSSVRKLKSKRSSNYGTYRVLSIMEVVHRVSKSDWFVELIQRLLACSRADTEEYCQAIVTELLDLLLQLEEGKVLPHLSFRDPEIQFVATLKTLHVFCMAMPSLLVPYKDTLVVYLKRDDRLSAGAHVQVFILAIKMIALVYPAMDKPVESWTMALEEDLKALVLHAPPSVVKPSVECLAVLALGGSESRVPHVLFDLLQQFYKYLVKIEPILRSAVPSISAEMQTRLQRALYVTGLICGQLDWGLYDTDNKLGAGSVQTLLMVLELVYGVYHRFTLLPDSLVTFTSPFRVKTLQGLGFMFHQHPRLFLQAHEHQILSTALLNSLPEVRLQMAVSLTELLQAEEARLEKSQAAKKQNKQQVQGDQRGDTSLIGSIMQAQLSNVLTLAVQKEAAIRFQAVTCIGLLVTQGVTNPLECFATLVALEADQVPQIRSAAHEHVLDALPKCVHSCVPAAVDGIFKSFQLQRRAFGRWTVHDKAKSCLLGRMYSACMAPQRSRRNSFFNMLLGLFREKGQVFQLMADGSLPRSDGLSYLSYVAAVIAALPYAHEDEPLYLIHAVNRDVSLHLETVRLQVKKAFPKIDFEHKWPLGGKTERPQSLEVTSCLAFALALLLRLKIHLKHTYQLEDDKCQTYQPSHSTKAQDTAVSTALVGTVDLDVPADAMEYALGWKSFQYLWPIVQEDQEQMDFDATGAKAKKPRRPSSATKKAKSDAPRKSKGAKAQSPDAESHVI